MDRRYLLVAALLATVDAGAATFNKCVDESGHVTFTQAACPGGLAGESITVHRAVLVCRSAQLRRLLSLNRQRPKLKHLARSMLSGWFRLRWWL